MNQRGSDSRLRASMARWMLNLYPPYRASGARVIRVRPDFGEIVVRISLNWRTRNIVGTLFGGSMYTACDPVYMLMLMQILGKEYVVWDKAATIRFMKPGRSDLTVRFVIPGEEVEAIRQALRASPSVERLYTTDLVDSAGVVCARVEKLLYIARSDPARAQKVRSIFSRLF